MNIDQKLEQVENQFNIDFKAQIKEISSGYYLNPKIENNGGKKVINAIIEDRLNKGFNKTLIESVFPQEYFSNVGPIQVKIEYVEITNFKNN